MMTRDRKAPCRSRDVLSRDGGCNRADIAGLRFRPEEVDTR